MSFICDDNQNNTEAHGLVSPYVTDNGDDGESDDDSD